MEPVQEYKLVCRRGIYHSMLQHMTWTSTTQIDDHNVLGEMIYTNRCPSYITSTRMHADSLTWLVGG